MARIDELWCVDPSLKAMGFARFELYAEKDALAESGVIRGQKDGGTWARTDWCVDALGGLMEESPVGWANVLVLIEEPAHYDGGAGTAARNSGAILKLLGLAASIRGRVISYGGHVIMVPVRRWKGTVPKAVTARRIQRAWNWTGSDHNEADAVGIGDWWLRKGGQDLFGKGRRRCGRPCSCNGPRSSG